MTAGEFAYKHTILNSLELICHALFLVKCAVSSMCSATTDPNTLVEDLPQVCVIFVLARARACLHLWMRVGGYVPEKAQQQQEGRVWTAGGAGEAPDGAKKKSSLCVLS